MTFDRDNDRTEQMAKLRLKIPHDWEDLDALGAKDLEHKIVECQANYVENERERKMDRKLTAAKDKLAEAAAPYKEAKDRLSRMMAYCTHRLEELGKR
ncbi:hypothetical protein Rctr197k_015 [Virus Rctr197k]|nr:hypothetical protein Rctr197k_015 [Virus Rctr197k]